MVLFDHLDYLLDVVGHNFLIVACLRPHTGKDRVLKLIRLAEAHLGTLFLCSLGGCFVRGYLLLVSQFQDAFRTVSNFDK